MDITLRHVVKYITIKLIRKNRNEQFFANNKCHVFFVIVETSITKGVKRAFCVDIGAVIADVVFILVATFSAQPLRNSLAENPR